MPRVNNHTMVEVDFSIPFCSGSVDTALMASSEVGLAQCLLCLERDLRRWGPPGVKLHRMAVLLHG